MWHNLGPTQPCYACGGATTAKGLECVMCGARCRKKCNNLTRNDAAQCQRLNSFICNHCNSSAGDRERCSVCRKGFRRHQYREICNVCISPCHLACTQQRPRQVNNWRQAMDLLFSSSCCCCCCWSHCMRLKMILSSASDAHGRRTRSSRVLPRPRR